MQVELDEVVQALKDHSMPVARIQAVCQTIVGRALAREGRPGMSVKVASVHLPGDTVDSPETMRHLIGQLKVQGIVTETAGAPASADLPRYPALEGGPDAGS